MRNTYGTYNLPGLGAVLVQSYGENGPTSPAVGVIQPKKELQNEALDWVEWGEDNLFPQNALEKIRNSPILAPIMSWKMKALASMEVRYGYKEEQADGSIKWRFKVIPELERILQFSNIKRYLRDAALQGYALNEPFIQLIKSKDQKKIVQFACGRSKDYRKGKMNDKGEIEKVYISADWENGRIKDPIEKRFLDINDSDNVYKFRNMSDYDVILNNPFNETGGDYYQEPPWWSVVRSLVYDNSQNLHRIKSARQKNSAAPKFILKIPSKHWQRRFKDFDKKTEKEQNELIDKEIKKWADTFGGVDKQGNMLWTEYDIDTVKGLEYGGWKLEKIEYDKGDENVKDSALFTSHMLMALEVDGSVLGMIPGFDGLGNSGGSNKREAMNLWLATQAPYFDILMEPLKLIAEYNLKDPDLEFTSQQLYIQQLNQVSPAERVPQNNN